MDCSTPGLPVHHQLPEFTQTHVHWVSDAIQSSHPLLSPSPPTFNLSQHQGLFKWVSSLHQVAQVLEFQYSCNYSYLKKKTIILTLYLLLLLVAYNYWVVGIALAFSQAFCTFTHLLLTTPSICAYKLLLQLCPMNLWTIAHQAPLSMGFCRQEYWSGCHAFLQGIFLTLGLNPCLRSPSLAGRLFTTVPPGKPHNTMLLSQPSGAQLRPETCGESICPQSHSNADQKVFFHIWVQPFWLCPPNFFISQPPIQNILHGL